MVVEVTNAHARRQSEQNIATTAAVIRASSIGNLEDLQAMDQTDGMLANPDARKSKRSLASERESWPAWRIHGAWFVDHKVFDVFMGLVVAFNLYLIVLDTDAQASCNHDDGSSCGDNTVRMLNWSLLLFYTLECLARVCFLQRQFMKNNWNIADAVVLFICYVEALFWVIDVNLQELQVIRIIRLGRIMRLVRLFKIFPSLYSMVRGFIGTTFAIWWGFCFILLMLLIWAIIAVEFIHPDSKGLYNDMDLDDGDAEWCAAAFSTVESALVYFFQTLVIGDSWGVCATPLIKKSKFNFWLLSFAFITVQLGITNLILAVIVDTAAKVREEDLEEKAEELHRQQEDARSVLMKMVQDMDDDDSGDITRDELLRSFEENIEFKTIMKVLGLEKGDVERLMMLLDVDKSGTLNYHELIDAITKAGKQDIGAQVMMMQLELKDVSLLLKKSLSTVGFSVDGAPVPDGLRTSADVNSMSKEVNLDGFPAIPLERVTTASVPNRSLVVSLHDRTQSPSLIALDHQLRLMGQKLTDRLHAISAEAEQEVFRLACSARQINSLNTTDSSTAPPDSARSTDDFFKLSDAAGRAALALPASDAHKKQQQQPAVAAAGRSHPQDSGSSTGLVSVGQG